MKKNIINSLVISQNEIDHLIIENKKNSFNIIGLSYFQINFNDKKNFSESISTIAGYIKKNRLTNIVLINDEVLRYVFILNKEESSNIRAIILNNFKNIFDINLADYYIDFEIFDFQGNNIVFAAGIKREIVDELVEMLNKYKFRLLCIETEINSLKRFLCFHGIEEVFINIHLLKNSTLFLIMKKNILFTFRELKFGFSNIINELIMDTGKSEQFILNELKEKGFDSEEINISSKFDRLTIEIQRTIDFYQNQYKFEPVSKFILTGNFQNIKKSDKFFSNLFMVETNYIKPLQKGNISIKTEDLEKIEFLTEAI